MYSLPVDQTTLAHFVVEFADDTIYHIYTDPKVGNPREAINWYQYDNDSTDPQDPEITQSGFMDGVPDEAFVTENLVRLYGDDVSLSNGRIYFSDMESVDFLGNLNASTLEDDYEGNIAALNEDLGIDLQDHS